MPDIPLVGVGIDDFTLKLIGKIESVALPQRGTEFVRTINWDHFPPQYRMAEQINT